VTSVVSPLRITFSVPAGWFKGNVPFAAWEGDTNSNVAFESPDNLYVDPCDPGRGLQQPAVGSTVDAFATALAGLPGIAVSAPADVTLGGYSGKMLDMTSETPAGCEETALWDDMDIAVPAPGPGSTRRLWILDVDGTRLVIVRNARAEASVDVVAELQRVVDSIRIDAP
jgi:hypothetical protein